MNTFMPLLETRHDGDAAPARGEQSERKSVPTFPTHVQLPQELEQELREISNAFAIDTTKLKEIVKQFGAELDDGLKEMNQNIVCCRTPTVWQ